MFKFRNYSFKDFNLLLLGLIYGLGFLGIYLISILQDEGENLYQKQILGYGAGLVAILFIAMVDYHFICKFSALIYLLSLALLLICKYSNSLPIYGWSHYTARRWIKIGGDPTAGSKNEGFEFQPSEMTKIAMIICMAAYFNLVRKYIKKLWVLLVSIVIMGLQVYLIFDQPDLSTSMVLMLMYAVMVFASGVPYKFLLPIVAVAIPAAYGFFWYVQQDFQTLLEDYQVNRIYAALHPEQYPELMYQQTNAKTAIQSGGVIGKFFSGNTGTLGSKYVPVKESDFIFCAVSEEFGFIGASVVIILYLILIILIIRIARRAKDYLGMLLALGIGSLICFQVFINIGVVTSLLPNTGIPLPFMSSGLTSLAANLVLVGILLNIGMQPYDYVPKVEDKDDLIIREY